MTAQNKKPDLIQAVIEGNLEKVRKLLPTANVNERDVERCYSALHYAAAAGNHRLVGMLVRAGADVNAKGYHGETPLSEAVIRDLDDTVRLLVKLGADVNVLNDQSYRPLMEAAQTGSYNAAVALLECGAEPSAKDRLGRTAADMGRLHLDSKFEQVLSGEYQKSNIYRFRLLEKKVSMLERQVSKLKAEFDKKTSPTVIPDKLSIPQKIRNIWKKS